MSKIALYLSKNKLIRIKEALSNGPDQKDLEILKAIDICLEYYSP